MSLYAQHGCVTSLEIITDNNNKESRYGEMYHGKSIVKIRARYVIQYSIV